MNIENTENTANTEHNMIIENTENIENTASTENTANPQHPELGARAAQDGAPDSDSLLGAFRSAEMRIDPSSLSRRMASNEKVIIETLDAGPERMALVLSSALDSTLYSEKWGGQKSYPVLVVRERPGSESGKPDNASNWTILGVYRHVQLLEGGTFEFVPRNERLTRENGNKATLVMRTQGAIRTFRHVDDEAVSEQKYGC